MQDLRRKDIDVLRAMAVLPVIIFHFKNEYFPLGYLGVDIFFVISGYLIAKIILKDLTNNSFSYVGFYTRRVKRILPAFLFVIIISLFFAIFILLNSDLKAFSESIISSLFFVQNIYYWITGGYFGTENELKPLLHLWSLGIEIQFYIFFPIFFIFLYKIKFTFKKIIIFIILISLISLLLNVFLIFKGHRDSLFFLFPFRIWEFGLGILTALIQNKNKNYFYLEKYRTLIGLAFIVFNYIYKINYLPDSFLICVGTALLLFRENITKNFFHKFFNSQALIFIGLISYSLYLWHWPVATYLKYISVDKLSNNYIFFGILLTVMFSLFSWKYVERPFLENKEKSKFIFRYVFILYCLLASLSLLILANKNIPSTHNKDLNKLSSAIGSTYHCSFLNYHFYGDSFGCLVNNKSEKKYSVAIFGNSHAAMYGWAIKKKLNEDNSQALMLHINDCSPFKQVNISLNCIRKVDNYVDSIIKDSQIKKVIIGLNWYSNQLIDRNGKLLDETNFDKRNDLLIKLIDELTENKKEVYLIGPINMPNFTFSNELRKLAFDKTNKFSLSAPKKDFLEEHSKSINLFSDKLSSKFLRPDKILCSGEKCFLGNLNSFYFSDNNHLSKDGSIRLFKLFEDINFN